MPLYVLADRGARRDQPLNWTRLQNYACVRVVTPMEKERRLPGVPSLQKPQHKGASLRTGAAILIARAPALLINARSHVQEQQLTVFSAPAGDCHTSLMGQGAEPFLLLHASQ